MWQNSIILWVIRNLPVLAAGAGIIFLAIWINNSAYDRCHAKWDAQVAADKIAINTKLEEGRTIADNSAAKNVVSKAIYQKDINYLRKRLENEITKNRAIYDSCKLSPDFLQWRTDALRRANQGSSVISGAIGQKPN